MHVRGGAMAPAAMRNAIASQSSASSPSCRKVALASGLASRPRTAPATAAISVESMPPLSSTPAAEASLRRSRTDSSRQAAKFAAWSSSLTPGAEAAGLQ